ncbi:hypothetical protein ACFW7J_15840 [Streptomyces sp. NPDC059525]|uniref:hypothetical protein n=1 Tax=Streptomyces sp. NPDC059525 TaxID=3346857 RepID=UPI0036B5B135
MTVTATAPGHGSAVPHTAARPAVAGHPLVRAVGSPLSIEECRAKWKIACYTPLQYREAYDLNPLYRAGITGKGRTIVIVDSFGSPTVQHDLDVYSRQFGIPSTQVQVVKSARRGTPDISMAAAVDGGAWIYSSYDPSATGWDVSGGTSESSPLFSGIVALADQAAGRRLGDIHEALYRLYGRSAYDRSTGIVDVNDGTDNSYQGVTGYAAVNGYDMAAGVGTLDAARFVPALAREGRRG